MDKLHTTESMISGFVVDEKEFDTAESAIESQLEGVRSKGEIITKSYIQIISAQCITRQTVILAQEASHYKPRHPKVLFFECLNKCKYFNNEYKLYL